jgi:hypothetical protein
MLRPDQLQEMAETVPHGPLIPPRMQAAAAAETLRQAHRQQAVVVVVEMAQQAMPASLPQDL